jgi:hypothetical protein
LTNDQLHWRARFRCRFHAIFQPVEQGLCGTPAELRNEWEWTPSAFVTLEAGIVSYSNDQAPISDTRELLTRIRLSRPF